MMNRVTVIDRRSSGRKRIVIRPRSRATALNQSDSCNVIDWTIGDAFLACSQAWAASRGLYGPARLSPNHARMPSRTSLPTCPEHAHRRPHTRRQSASARSRARVLRAGRELSAGARCAARCPRSPALDRLPSGRRRGVHGRSVRQAYRTAGHRLRHARPEVPIVQPAPQELGRLRSLLASAQRPMAVAGGSGWNAQACANLARFAEANALPVACAFRNQDVFDNRHPNYAGDVGIGINPKLAARIRVADVLLVVGERLGEMVTGGYTLLAAPQPKQALIHVHPGAEELGRVYQPALAIQASVAPACAALAAMAPIDAPAWSGSAAVAHAEYLAWQTPRPMPGALDLWQVVATLRERLPEDAILASGAGNYATWLHRLYRYPRFRTQLAPYNGSMGYGVPAAIAAKAAQPERTVVSWNGDGCFLMNGQELATAVQYRLGIVFVVVDNGMYGTIRMHQERQYPARVYATDLVNPDFAALARAYGAAGETVTRTEEFAPALERALAARRPALLHLLVDRQAITMNATIDDLRRQATAPPPAR